MLSSEPRTAQRMSSIVHYIILTIKVMGIKRCSLVATNLRVVPVLFGNESLFDRTWPNATQPNPTHGHVWADPLPIRGCPHAQEQEEPKRRSKGRP